MIFDIPNIVNYPVSLQVILQTFRGIQRYLTVHGKPGRYEKNPDKPFIQGLLKPVRVRRGSFTLII